MYSTAEQLLDREKEISRIALNHGFLPLGRNRFLKHGKVYDLSAADLTQLERIQREGHFVVGFD
jgi:hypothetical protein